MYKRAFNPLSLWQFNNLSSYSEIVHYVSGREGGVSENGTLNLSYKTGDKPENVKTNRSFISTSLGIHANRLFFPEQTHSVNIKVVTTSTNLENLSDTDSLITNEKDICISVLSADCVPILLYDPVKKAAGALHAGWRGTVGRLLERTILSMNDKFGTSPSDLVVAIGPSICPQVYEVGEEVIKAAMNVFHNTEGVLLPSNTPGKAYFNLWEANRRQAIHSGAQARNIELAELCTYTNSNDFFSARKIKNQQGRFAAGIMIKEAVERN